MYYDPMRGGMPGFGGFGMPGGVGVGPINVPGQTFGSMSGPDLSGIGRAVTGAMGGVGNAVGGAVNWLTDPESGANRQMLLSNLIGGAASIYGTHKAAREREQLREDELRREREARERYESLNPVRTQMLGRILSTL